MELAFALIDFFAENEDHLRGQRSYWKQNGQRYFISACINAVRHGWRGESARLERQREGL